jgi:shikimate 5-dehydrogenase
VGKDRQAAKSAKNPKYMDTYLILWDAVIANEKYLLATAETRADWAVDGMEMTGMTAADGLRRARGLAPATSPSIVTSGGAEFGI